MESSLSSTTSWIDTTTTTTNETSKNAPTSTAMMDITHLFEECASSLSESDPLLCNPITFSLHDAMGATQLMDRKMDCCEIPADQVIQQGMPIPPPDTMVFPRPIPLGLHDDFSPLPWDALTLPDAACIGLEILVRLQALLSGSSVEESTFTCLYAHMNVMLDARMMLVPESLEEQFKGLLNDKPREQVAQFVVFAMSLALVDITEIFRGIVQNADIYEEEDFVSSISDLRLFTEVEEMNTFRVLEEGLKLVGSLPGQDLCEVQIVQLTLGCLLGILSQCSKLVSDCVLFLSLVALVRFNPIQSLTCQD
jgi:hypothetical protein